MVLKVTLPAASVSCTPRKSLGLVPRSGPIGLPNVARELLNDGQSILRADESIGPQLIADARL